MNEAQVYFMAESIRHARSLPFSDCIRFICGMLDSLHEDGAGVAELRKTYRALVESDQQLELIQVGQLKLNLASAKPTRRKGARR